MKKTGSGSFKAEGRLREARARRGRLRRQRLGARARRLRPARRARPFPETERQGERPTHWTRGKRSPRAAPFKQREQRREWPFMAISNGGASLESPAPALARQRLAAHENGPTLVIAIIRSTCALRVRVGSPRPGVEAGPEQTRASVLAARSADFVARGSRGGGVAEDEGRGEARAVAMAPASTPGRKPGVEVRRAGRRRSRAGGRHRVESGRSRRRTRGPRRR